MKALEPNPYRIEGDVVHMTLPGPEGRVARYSLRHLDRVRTVRWYLYRSLKRRTVYAQSNTHPRSLHRFILMITDPKTTVDHRDRDGINCTDENLRVCTGSENIANSVRYRPTGAYRGVYQNRYGKYEARIRVRGIRTYLGGFVTAQEAAQAYDTAAVAHFGEFARLNFCRLCGKRLKPEDAQLCAECEQFQKAA